MGSWVHRCPWCEWARQGDSPTMLAPRCESCGGLLEAVPAGSLAVADGSPFRVATPHLSPAFGRILRFALFALLMFAAGRFGWGAGGPGLATTAVGVVGLFTVPLIVEE
jgi:prepilin signal peptidase PulO-like enzyme (type II secretory pathway)